MERMYEIIKILLQNEGYVSFDKLARILEVSTRTIRMDMEKAEDFLQKYGVRIWRDRRLGVMIEEDIPDEVFEQITKKLKTADFYDGKERQGLIMEAFLLEQKELTVNYLVQLTKSSRSTVLKDLICCENAFAQNNIAIVKKPYVGMHLSYREWDYRSAVLRHIVTYTKQVSYFSLYKNIEMGGALHFGAMVSNIIRCFTEGLDLAKIQKFIKDYEEREGIRFTDEANINIFLYLCIALKRTEKGLRIKRDEVKGGFLTDGGAVTDEVRYYEAHIRSEWDRKLGEEEISCLLCFISAQNKIFSSQNDSFVNEKELVMQYVQAVEALLGIQLTGDEELFNGLLLHIVPTIHRLLHHLKVDNPLKDEIRLRFPEIYRACRKAAVVFEKWLHCEVDEDELGLLTLHVAAAIERMKQNARAQHMKRAAVVCLSGIGTSNMLIARLGTEFPSLLITRAYTMDELRNMDMRDIDFIISTVPLALNIRKKVIRVDTLLGEKDVERIKNYIYRTDIRSKPRQQKDLTDELMALISDVCAPDDLPRVRERMKSFFREKNYADVQEKKGLARYLTEEATRLGASADNWREAIRQAGEVLLNLGCIEERYIEEMIRAVVQMGPFIVLDKGIALAHAGPKDGVLKTGMSFVTLQNGVDFGTESGDPVKIVIGLAADGTAEHIEAINELSDFLARDQAVEKWYEQKTKKDFIQFALSGR